MDKSENPRLPIQPENRFTDLNQYLRITLRHKWLITFVIIIILSSVLISLKRAVPEYRTSVKLLIEGKTGYSALKDSSFGLELIGQDKLAKQQATYSELIKSRQLLSKIIVNLKMDEMIEVDRKPKEELSEELKIRYVVEKLQKAIEVRLIKNTDILEVSVSGTDPEMVTNIANELAKVLIDYNLQSLVSEAKAGYEFIDEQSDILSKRLQESEEKLRAFKEKERIVELSQESRLILEKLSQVETNYNNTLMQRQETDVRLNTVKNELNTQSETVKSITISENPIVQQLKGQLYNLEIELAGLLKTYPETAPEVLQVKTKINQAMGKLQQEVGRMVTAEVSSVNPVHQSLIDRLIQLQADAIAFDIKEKAQKESLEQLKAELERLPLKELQLARLERDKGVANQTYMMLMQRKEEMRIAQAAQKGNISVIDPAVKPLHPYKPQKKLNLMLGLLLGLLLGTSLAFFIEYLDKTIRTPDDVTQYLGLTVLGIIPEYQGAKESKDPPLIVNKEVRESTTEAYRSLRANIMAHTGNPIKTIAITSATPQEGKSITSANLAVALSQAGKNVLLIDADLRRPSLHRIFNVDRSNGLSSILSGESASHDAIIKADKLSFISTGPLPLDPSVLVGSEQMKNLIAQFKEEYDLVLFDTPPVLGLSDSLDLTSKTDGTILVIKAGKATRKLLKIMVSQLEEIGANIIGVVLNNVNLKRDKYYSDYYYYYSSYYYEDNNGVEKRRRSKK